MLLVPFLWALLCPGVVLAGQGAPDSTLAAGVTLPLAHGSTSSSRNNIGNPHGHGADVSGRRVIRDAAELPRDLLYTGVSAPLSGPVCSVADFGAVADNATVNTESIQAAIEACAKAAPAGSTVLIPPGAYRTASIELRSNMRFHLAAGAGLYGVPGNNYSAYRVRRQWFGGGWVDYFMPLLSGFNLTNVAITGSNDRVLPGNSSIVDGVGWWWWCRVKQPLMQPFCEDFNPNSTGLPKPQRPRLVGLYNSTDVTLAGFTAQNSAMWTVHVQLSKDVLIQNMTVLSPRGIGNTDGIDPESCTNVAVLDSHVDVGDDGISLKSYNMTIGDKNIMMPLRNVTIRNVNILSRNWCIGSGTFGGVYDVLMEDCRIGASDHVTVPWAIKFKSHQYYPGPIENVTVRRVAIGMSGPTPWMYPTYGGGVWELGLSYGGRPPAHSFGAPRVRNITFEDISVVSGRPGSIVGLNNSCFEYLTFKNVTFGTVQRPGTWTCEKIDLKTFIDIDNVPRIGDNCDWCSADWSASR